MSFLRSRRGTFLSSSPHYFWHPIIITYCSSSARRRLAKRTDAHTNKDFPQLSPTFLAAKVVDTNLVPRYLTVAARASRCFKSYSPFLCWSHSNRRVGVWYLIIKLLRESFSNFLVTRSSIRVRLKAAGVKLSNA